MCSARFWFALRTVCQLSHLYFDIFIVTVIPHNVPNVQKWDLLLQSLQLVRQSIGIYLIALSLSLTTFLFLLLLLFQLYYIFVKSVTEKPVTCASKYAAE